MLHSLDRSFDILSRIKDDLLQSASDQQNESDTRFKIIDRFLVEVLFWPRDAIFTEPHTDSGFIDYLLTIGERRNTLVIEAKRTGFLTAATKSTGIQFLQLSGPALKPLVPAIKQALGYATEKGVPAAVVTDGTTWLFFKASRTDGKPPIEGKGILFPDLQSILDNYSKFYELLAHRPVIDRRHLAHLNDAEGITISEVEQQYFVFPPSEARLKQRDPLAQDASLLFSQFFSRLSNDQDREMLRDCFVETHESRKADLELQKIIQKVLNNISAIKTTHGGALQAELERVITSHTSETVLLIGNKGSGKSTFIDRFFDHILPNAVRQQCAVCRIDLAEYHGDPKSIVSWCILQLRRNLETAICSNNPPSYEDLQGIFFDEYQRWTNGARRPLYESDKTRFKIEFGDHMEKRREHHPDEYVQLLLSWAAKGQRKLPCLVFDNTDQFSVDVQDAVYQLAHSIERTAPVFNIVPITDRTVWRLSKAGALQSYASKSFYLPVPDAKEIITRRVTFLKTKLQSEPKAAHAYFSRKGFHVETNNLQMLAEAVEKIFIENDYVSGLIGRLGNFDIRRMLKLAERIFLSPEVKIDDIIKSKFGGPLVTNDRFRTHRALIKGEYDRFNETENEFISNLFYSNPLKPSSPLLSFYILWVLRQRAVGARDDTVEAKHWEVSELREYFEHCGVAEDLVLNGIRRLYERRLIEALDPNLTQIEMSDRVAIKESGVAHIELVTSSTVYIEQMALVTGLGNISIRDELKSRVRARAFVEVRDIFIKHVLRTDAARMEIPSTRHYAPLTEARRTVRDIVAGDRPPPRRYTDSRERLGGRSLIAAIRRNG